MRLNQTCSFLTFRCSFLMKFSGLALGWQPSEILNRIICNICCYSLLTLKTIISTSQISAGHAESQIEGEWTGGKQSFRCMNHLCISPVTGSVTHLLVRNCCSIWNALALCLREESRLDFIAWSQWLISEVRNVGTQGCSLIWKSCPQ